MSIDPKARSVTTFFMLAAVIVMLALAWSISRDADDDIAPETPAVPTE